MTLAQERELLQRIKTDRKEFGTLFDHYYKPIFGYLYRRTGEYDLSKDMAAETFLKAFLSIEKFVWRDVSISSWLYRIATNEANLFFRRKKYLPLRLESVLNYEILRLTDTEAERKELESKLKDLEEFTLIQQKLKSLDVSYQEVISLRYFESKDNREIGIILNKPEGTVKSLLSRGLKKLRMLVLP